MKPAKVIALVALAVVVVIGAYVTYRALVFAREAGDVLLATLRSGQRTAEYNERIAASLAQANLPEKLAGLTAGLDSALGETTKTLQALQPVLAETTATTRAARVAITESAEAAKAARIAIEGAKAPDLDKVLQRTDALLEQTGTLLAHTDASVPPLLAASQRLVDRVDGLVAGSELTQTLRTTGRLLANIEGDQKNVSTLIANAVPVSETIKNESAFVEQDLARIREKRGRVRRFFSVLFGWL
jgi:hypothetical protein